MHFYISNLTNIEFMTLYFSAMLILIAYISQENNLLSILNKKTNLLQYDLIKSEVMFTFNNPKLAKFFLYPAMWILLSISILTVFLFPEAKFKFLFYILAVALLIQNYINYNFILDTAIEMEKSNKPIDIILKEKEWFVMRDTIKKQLSQQEKEDFINKLKLTKIKDLSKLKFKKDSDSEYFENKNDLYEIYKTGSGFTIDKLELILSPTFSQLYKEIDLSIKYRNSFIEAIFVIITLYLSITMRSL